ncbi:MAG: hypothetical protein WC722_00800 [Rhodospirillales bacterium]|jgi:hypothetical protein
MSQSIIPSLPFHHGDVGRAALSLGVLGGAIAGTMAAGSNLAQLQEGRLDREEAIVTTLRAALCGSLAGSLGGAAAAAFGVSRGTRLLAFVGGVAAFSYLSAAKMPGKAKNNSVPATPSDETDA